MINVSQTIKNSCKADKNTHTEYIVINGQTIYIKGKLSATAYKDTTFIGTFNMKVLEFETENTTQFRNREFEYYKVIDGNSFKIGTFITTEIVDNDSKEMVKVTANDYALKFAIPYTSSLNYDSGEVKLLDVLKECCDLAGVELENTELTNGNFIVDSNQFVNGELVGDVVCAIAGMSCDFATITENDKLRLLFKNHTESLLNMTGTTSSIETSGLNNIELLGNTTQSTTTGKNLLGLINGTYTNNGMTAVVNNGEISLSGTASANAFVEITSNTINWASGQSNTISAFNSVANSNVRIRITSAGTYDTILDSINKKNTITYNSGEGIYTQKITIRVQSGTSISTSSPFKFKPQIEVGSGTSYEPYTNGASPNPDYPQEVVNVTGRQEVKCVGKNLCNIANVQVGKGWNNATQTQRATILYIPISRNKSYTLSSTWTNSSITNIRAVFNYGPSDISYNQVPSSYPYSNTQFDYVSIEILANTTFTSSMLDGVQIMFCEGSSTDYEPYKEETNEINLGKNLFDISTETAGIFISATDGSISSNSVWTQSDYIKVSPNTTYTMSSSVATNNGGSWEISNYNNSKTWVSSAQYGTINVKYYTITTGNNVEYIRLGYRNDRYQDIQFEKGNTATSYAPYFTPIELCKLGSNEDKIFKTTGKNIFDEEIELGSIDVNTGELVASSSRTRSKNFIKVKPNTTYRITRQVGANRWVIGYTKDKVGITDGGHSGYAGAIVSMGSSTLTQAFTTSATTEYIKWYDTSSTNLTEQVMISKGSSNVDYEPYGNGEWYKKAEIGKIEFDGSSDESWADRPNYTYADRFVCSVTNAIKAKNGVHAGYSNYFEVKDNSNQTYPYVDTNDTQFVFNYTAKGTTTLSQFKTWLSTHNTIVYYVLATPTYTKLNDTLQEQLNSIRLLEGTNNVMSSVPIDLDYYGTDSEIIEDYTDLDDKRDTQPITSVSIGSSVVKGVEATLKDDNLINEYGEHWLILNDNPLAYTYDKRKELVKAIFNKIKGFGYSSFKSKYTYKPYLTLGDTIKFKNKDGEYIDSMILRYNFNNDDCTFEAPSITSATIDYENNSGAEEMARRAEIIANQATATLTSVVSQVTTIEQEVNGETTFELTKDTQYESNKEYYTYDSEEDTYVLLQEGVDYQIGETISGDVYEITITDNLSSQLASIKKVIETLDETLLKQTSDQFEMLFNKTGIANDYKTLKKLVDEDADYLSKVDQYIRFAGASIELGKRDNPVKLVITNDRISFMTGDTESAYISDNQLYITDSTILNKLRVGHWETKEDDLGNLNTRWVND